MITAVLGQIQFDFKMIRFVRDTFWRCRISVSFYLFEDKFEKGPIIRLKKIKRGNFFLNRSIFFHTKIRRFYGKVFFRKALP